MLAAPPSASATPPNDSWVNREVVTALPFHDFETDIENATLDTGDPLVPCGVTGRRPGGNTVWYSYRTGPRAEYVTLSTQNSSADFNSMLAVYEGTPGALRMITGGCNDDGAPSSKSRISGLRLA